MNQAYTGGEGLRRAQGAARAGLLELAFREAVTALERGERHPVLFSLRGAFNEREGRLGEAIADFQRSVELDGSNFATLNALGLCLARFGAELEGLRALDRSIGLNSRFAPSHFNRGYALELAGEHRAARAAYEKALEIDPGLTAALGQLAVLAARHGDWDRSRAVAGRALARQPQSSTALTALALTELGEGRPSVAEDILRGLLADPVLGPHERGVAQGLLADCLDVQGRYPEAFAAYEAENASLRIVHGPRFAPGGQEPASSLAARLLEQAAHFKAPRRDGLPAAPVGGHVFIVGFPRSGTTLLGQGLARHPHAVVLDEKECLAEAATRFARIGANLSDLASADADLIEAARRSYWRRVRSFGTVLSMDKVFIDKLPMNILYLPLIELLFPAAKVLLCDRDPRDVVLSAFTRHFVVNPSTWELLTLEGAAKFYDILMRLRRRYTEVLALKIRACRYETLVEDYSGEMSAILGFIGLPGSSACERLPPARPAEEIATPSGLQVARGLYRTGVGRWRRYAEALEPIEPVLAPWLGYLGYAPASDLAPAFERSMTAHSVD